MSNSAKGIAITSIGILIMSLESLFIKFTSVSSFLFSFYIGIFMFISMATTFLFKEKEYLKNALKTSLPLMLICSACMATSNIFFITAVKTTTVANVVIIFSTSALFTALIAAGAFIKIPVPVVPFTLQYLFTMLAGLFLGSRRGMISVVAYMLLGLAGLPIFSEGGGIWYIFKPSFGYIIGFCLGTYVTGLIAERLKQKTVFHYLLANLAGLMIVYACGMVYYYVICNYVIDTPIGIWPLILYCFLLAVPGDIALSVLGAVIAKRVRPVVLQYLFDSKSNVRLEREELVK